MREWRHTCLSQPESESKDKPQLNRMSFKDEAGITLVELLAALAIMSIVFLLASSLHIFGEKQFRSQTKSAYQVNDLNYAMSEMTRDLRNYAPGQISVSEDGKTIFILDADEDTNEYSQEEDKLMYNDIVIIDGISNLKAEISDDGGMLFISLSISSDEPGIMDKKYNASVYLRNEPDGDSVGTPVETSETIPVE